MTVTEHVLGPITVGAINTPKGYRVMVKLPATDSVNCELKMTAEYARKLARELDAFADMIDPRVPETTS